MLLPEQSRDKVFSPDSRFYAALSLAADLVIVNVAMVIAALPVITGGAAVRAGGFVIRQLAREEGSKSLRTFAQEFRRDLGKSTGMWLAVVSVTVLSLYERWVFGNVALPPTLIFLFTAGIVSGLIIVYGVATWFYPDCDLRYAVVAAFAHAPRTIAAVFLLALPLFVIVFSPAISVSSVAFTRSSDGR